MDKAAAFSIALLALVAISAVSLLAVPPLIVLAQDALEGSLLFPEPVDAIWAGRFFSNVSSAREAPLALCPTLSEFAWLRFNTSVSRPWLSHYGNQEDNARYFSDVYYTKFGEEIFYPEGYPPSSFASGLQESAPVHWEGLVDPEFRYYGYHLGRGPAYELVGPCPKTEIPGPMIDIREYFGRYGCTVSESDKTYLVIELASSCPDLRGVE